MTDIQAAPRNLFRLVYSSRFTGPERALGETLRSVIAQSIQKNRMVDVTGFLLAGEGRFLQLLEGREDAVRETYDRIGKDSRHTDLVLIQEGAAERRLFRDWNMGQHRLGLADRALLTEAGLSVFEPAELDAEAAVNLLTVAGGRYLR
jgi:hypothetical protein